MEQSFKAKEHNLTQHVAPFDVTITVNIDRELSVFEKAELRKICEQAKDTLLEYTIVQDPKNIEKKEKDRLDLMGCFPSRVYWRVEELPNGYDEKSPYWSAFPWYRVLSPIGWITVGRRDTTIQVDWGYTKVRDLATKLFPDNPRSKESWRLEFDTYAEAKACIDKLLSLESQYPDI